MSKITAAILAGGKSSRFEGGNKALALLNGKPLIQHVIDRLSPQADDLVFSGEEYSLTNVDLPSPPNWVADLSPGQKGPLIALLSCLEHLQTTDSEWLLTSACDTPMLPTDLADKLLVSLAASDRLIAIPEEGDRLQPANGLWHRDVYPALKTAIDEQDMRGFHQFLDTQSYSTTSWPAECNHFINLNTQLDLVAAEQLITSQ